MKDEFIVILLVAIVAFVGIVFVFNENGTIVSQSTEYSVINAEEDLVGQAMWISRNTREGKPCYCPSSVSENGYSCWYAGHWGVEDVTEEYCYYTCPSISGVDMALKRCNSRISR